jgi:hypothetical protein
MENKPSNFTQLNLNTQTQPVTSGNHKSITRFIPFTIFVAVIIFIIYLFNEGAVSLLPSPYTQKNVVEMKFTDKRYQANYTDKYSKSSTVEIASFEDNEVWEGDGTYEDDNYMDGKMSLALKSKDKQPVVSTLNTRVNLKDYAVIKMLTFVAKADDADNIQSLIVRFASKEGVVEYPIVNVKVGWSVIKMPKDKFFSEGKGNSNINWEEIQKIQIELTSRAKSTTEVLFDRIWAESDDNFKEDLKSNNYDNLSYKRFNGTNVLQLWGVGGGYSNIKKITSVRNFSYTAKIYPNKKGSFGISGRQDSATNFGYYLVFDGIDTNSWRLFKIGKIGTKTATTVLDQGSINNFTIEREKPIWLKMVLKGSKIKGYFSIDGSNFTPLANANDGEIKSGGVGFYTAGSSMIIESVEFSQ